MAAKTTNSNTASKKRGRPPKTLKNDLPSLDVLQEMYRDMLLIRRFEEKAGQLYGMGEIGGFCHLYIGQEAVVVGLQSVAEEGDSIVTSYRDHGHMLACGMDASGVMAELTGREGAILKARVVLCTCLAVRKIFMVVMASWPHKCLLAPVWRLLINIRMMARLIWLI